MTPTPECCLFAELPKDVWAGRVTLLTPCQVNAALLEATGNPKVKFMHCLPAFHDPNTTVGREIMEHTGMTPASKSPAKSSAPKPASSSTRPETASTPSRHSSSPPSDNAARRADITRTGC